MFAIPGEAHLLATATIPRPVRRQHVPQSRDTAVGPRGGAPATPAGGQP